MIDKEYVLAMAAYNRWQNDNLYGTADALSDAARKEDRGAFFGSIHVTLDHILWADEIWMGRLAGRQHPPSPKSGSLQRFESWDELKAARVGLDGDIAAWAATLDEAWLRQSLSWFSGAIKKQVSRSHWQLLAHMFNHQTHHRGQVHAMLTAAGVKPGDTDLMLLEM